MDGWQTGTSQREIHDKTKRKFFTCNSHKWVFLADKMFAFWNYFVKSCFIFEFFFLFFSKRIRQAQFLHRTPKYYRRGLSTGHLCWEIQRRQTDNNKVQNGPIRSSLDCRDKTAEVQNGSYLSHMSKIKRQKEPKTIGTTCFQYTENRFRSVWSWEKKDTSFFLKKK